MKAFIKNILAFSFTLIFISVLLVGTITFIYKQKLDSVNFDTNVSTVICGDSHTMSAVDDGLLKNAINISNHSQHYLYTYNVLRIVLNNNPQIKTVILGSSFHSFGEYDRIILNNDEASEFYPNFFPTLDYESATLIASKNFLSVLKSSSRMVKSMTRSIIKNYHSYRGFPFIGFYYKSQNSNLTDSTVITAIKRHYYLPDGKEQGLSNYQNKYLDKIGMLCRAGGVRLIIINTPVSDSYFRKIPKKFIENYYSTISNLNQNVDFWDFHALHLGDESFGDGDHLNTIGAKTLTLKIDSILQIQSHQNYHIVP
jgi:hypothetical protein